MKLNNFIALAACCVVGLNALGQSKNATTKWGPELKGSKRGTLTETIGYDETGYYVRGVEKGDVYLEKLDKNLNEVASWEFEEKDPVTKEKYNFEGITFFGGKLLLFQTQIDKKNDLATLFFKNVNTKTMVGEGKVSKLIDTEYHKVGGMFFSMAAAMAAVANADKFSIFKSREDKKLLIVANPTIKDKEANDRCGLVVLDTTFQTSWKKDIELPYNNKLFITEKWIVDDNGNAYVLGKLYKDKVKEFKRGQQNFKYHIIAFTSKGENKIDYEVTIPEKFITDINFRVSDAGDIVCGGFYSKMGNTSVDGCFYTVLDGKSKNVKVSNIKEFTLDFITQDMSEREEKKTRKKEEKGRDIELYQYDLDNMILKDDGGCVLVGEQYYVQVTTHSDGKTTYTTYTYYYNDIVVINVTPDGKIEWATKIPKYQRTTNDGGYYSSYAMSVTDNNIYFLYNDHKDNLDPTQKAGGTKNFSLRDKNGVITLATVDKAGKLTREALFSAAETEVNMRPKVCEQFKEDQMLLFGEKGKKEQFAIITFKK